jgi:hypothetical protein
MVIGIEIFDPKISSVHYMSKKEDNIVIFFERRWYKNLSYLKLYAF